MQFNVKALQTSIKNYMVQNEVERYLFSIQLKVLDCTYNSSFESLDDLQKLQISSLFHNSRYNSYQ